LKVRDSLNEKQNILQAQITWCLQGNRFIMALRNVIGYKHHIVAKLESLKNVGFINYNGNKCYVNAPMQLIGKNVLLQEWQTVRYYSVL
jgi:tRNA(Glu) U13 pseudouridine synthase TruD